MSWQKHTAAACSITHATPVHTEGSAHAAAGLPALPPRCPAAPPPRCPAALPPSPSSSTSSFSRSALGLCPKRSTLPSCTSTWISSFLHLQAGQGRAGRGGAGQGRGKGGHGRHERGGDRELGRHSGQQGGGCRRGLWQQGRSCTKALLNACVGLPGSAQPHPGMSALTTYSFSRCRQAGGGRYQALADEQQAGRQAGWLAGWLAGWQQQ